MNPRKKTIKSKPIIHFRRSLFWDVNPKNINAKKHSRYIIERILDFGEVREIRWLFSRYRKNTIKKVMNLPRSQVDPKSKSLWSLLIR